MKERFEIRKIDAIVYDGYWVCNNSYHICCFDTTSKDVKRAFLSALHKQGIYLKRGVCRVYYDGEVYTVEGRKDNEPVFVAIPINA